MNIAIVRVSVDRHDLLDKVARIALQLFFHFVANNRFRE